MGRVSEERKQELENKLIEVADTLLNISNELGACVHLNVNKYKRRPAYINMFIHYDNYDKGTFGMTSKLDAQPEELRGCLFEKPIWYTEVHDDEV